MHSAFTVLMP